MRKIQIVFTVYGPWNIQCDRDLQKQLDEGWTVVSCVSQSVAIHTGGFSKETFGTVIFILEKVV